MIYHTGQEPAFDLKRLLVAACKEAGLEILDAWMRLDPDRGRAIEVQAAQQQWPHPGTVQVHLDAYVQVDGTWPDSISVMASAPLPTEETSWLFAVPTLLHEVSVEQIVPAVHETLEQQAKIIAARQRGEEGPWIFGESEWRVLAADG